MSNLYFKIEAKEEDYLYINQSQIPNSGKGLFTAIPIFKDEIISVFKGKILTELQIKKRIESKSDQYFMNMIDGTILDCKNTNCFAKYANDAKAMKESVFKNNSIITLNENGVVCLVATKNIKSSDEIFCSYGKKYWKNHL